MNHHFWVRNILLGLILMIGIALLGSYYPSPVAASSLSNETLSLSYDASLDGNTYINAFAVYNRKLYAGSGYNSAIYVYDGTAWSHSFTADNGNSGSVWALAVFEGKLYAGTNYYDFSVGQNRSRIYVYDGVTWLVSKDYSPANDLHNILAFATYNGKLYASTGDYGKILVFDGTTWTDMGVSLGGQLYNLVAYNGKLYTAFDNVHVYDGANWTTLPALTGIYTLGTYNGKLYAGGTGGNVYVYDGTSWSISYTITGEFIRAMTVFNNKLYVGTESNGYLYVYDGSTWALSQDLPDSRLEVLGSYNNKLYLGTWFTGRIYELTPAVSYVFTGFFQPIDTNQPNTAKAGKTIPIKWRLADDNGVPISDPSSFVSVNSSPTSGSCSGIPDAIETYAGASGLQYLGDGYWQFNWKTPTSYAGQCRTMSLNLNDGGTGRTATFIFK